MGFEGGDDVLYPVVDGVVHRVVRPPGVTVETLLLILRSGPEKFGDFMATRRNARTIERCHTRAR